MKRIKEIQEEQIKELQQLANQKQISKVNNFNHDEYIKIALEKDLAKKALVIIKELQEENKKMNIFYKDSLSNIRWMLKEPRSTIFELKSQIESADSWAKNALEGKFMDDKIL